LKKTFNESITAVTNILNERHYQSIVQRRLLDQNFYIFFCLVAIHDDD